MVPTHAGHVSGCNGGRWRTEWDEEPAGSALLHHESGHATHKPVNRAKRTGIFLNVYNELCVCPALIMLVHWNELISQILYSQVYKIMVVYLFI